MKGIRCDFSEAEKRRTQSWAEGSGGIEQLSRCGKPATDMELDVIPGIEDAQNVNVSEATEYMPAGNQRLEHWTSTDPKRITEDIDERIGDYRLRKKSKTESADRVQIYRCHSLWVWIRQYLQLQ